MDRPAAGISRQRAKFVVKSSLCKCAPGLQAYAIDVPKLWPRYVETPRNATGGWVLKARVRLVLASLFADRAAFSLRGTCLSVQRALARLAPRRVGRRGVPGGAARRGTASARARLHDWRGGMTSGWRVP